MKNRFSLFVVGSIFASAGPAFSASVSLPVAAPALVEIGPNHRVWETAVQNIDPEGEVFVSTNRVTELATGLYYRQENGQWRESEDLVTIYPGGAIAQTGPYSVIFGNNLNTLDPIDLLSSDGKRFRNHFLGLSYFDTSSGESVLIAEVQDSIGELLPPNQVIYQNAAAGLKLDLRYTYRRDAFHADVILRANPPSPAAYGLNPDTTELQILTEFVEAPPVETSGPPTEGATADEIGFGAMEFGHGLAFLVDDSQVGEPTLMARKLWGKLEGRQFLIEKLDYRAIESQLSTLPASDQAGLKDLKTRVASIRQLPGPRLAAKTREPLKIAAALPARKGFVLDYVLLNTATNFSFYGNQTYYVSGAVNLSGRTTIEAGSVIKFTNTASAQITISGLIDCQATPYRPLILTAKDDNSIGFAIPGSSGTPSGWYGYGLSISSGGNRLDNVRFSYLEYAVSNSPSATQLDLSNVQFVKCRYPLNLQSYSTLNLFNGLFYSSDTLVKVPYSATIRGQHWTIDTCTNFLQVSPSGTVYTYLTNTLVTALTSWGANGPPTAFVSSTELSSASGVYQTVGAGGHYLASGSPYRNAGTTGIGLPLLTQLAKKTTYPPLVHDNFFTVDEVLAPQAQRDSDLPDQGYHYDPMDWVVYGREVSANLILTNGVVLGHYESYGLVMKPYGKLISEGTPANPNRIIRYNSVQEQATTAWAQSGWFGAIRPLLYADANPAEVRLRFTDLPAQSGDNHFFNGSTFGTWSLSDCQFHGSGTILANLSGASGLTVNYTNCLFERTDQTVDGRNSIAVTYRNNTFVYGSAQFTNNGSWSSQWLIQDNLFDNVALTDNGSAITNSYNGYINTTQLASSSGGNVTGSAANYQAGPFGRYYLPNNSPFLKAGSRAADAASLYHYTAQTDEAKLGTSSVDMGFHYVSVDPISLDSLVVDKGLVGYWKLDETSGTTAADSSGNAFDGTLTGGVSWSSGQVGGGASFNGSSGKISVNNASALQLSGDMTLALWCKESATNGNWVELVGKANTDLANYKINYELYVEPGGQRFYFEQLTNGVYLNLFSKTVVAPGTWYHVAVTVQGSIASIYVNGNLENTEIVPGLPAITTDPITFGYNGVTAYYQGNLDDVRIYNRALTANEVASLYAQRGLVAYWKLNDGSGTSASDSSGNNHTGSFVNSPAWTTGPRGGALSFDGSSAYVTSTAASDLNLTGDLTIAFWTKPNSSWPAGQWARMVGKGDVNNRPYGIWTDPSQKFLFQRYVSGGAENLYSQTTITSGTWYHVVGQVRGSKTYIYINGVLENSMNNAGASLSSTDVQTLAYAGYYNYYNGVLDDVRIYNRAITPNEIQTLYSQRGLVTHWKIDEGTGTQLADASDNNRTGTLQSSPSTPAWIDGVSGKALSFDGVDDWVTSTESAVQEITGDLTVAFWMRKTGTNSNWTRIVGKGGATNINYAIYTWPGSDRHLEFQQYLASPPFYRGVDTQTELQIGIWYHVAAVVRGSSASFYINGKLDGPPSWASGTAPTNSDPVTLGYNSVHGYYPGDLDDVRIYNRALSAGEIAALAAQKAVDSDADGIPDYLEDRNGNGVVNSGETDWNSNSDLGLKVLITVPKANSNLP